MSWYIWKRWRFAWSCGWARMLSRPVRDGHGEWMCVFGKLFFLIEPDHKTTMREKAIATFKFVISDPLQLALLAAMTAWIFADVAMSIGEVRPSYTIDASLLLHGLLLLFLWMRFGSLTGNLIDRLLKRWLG